MASIDEEQFSTKSKPTSSSSQKSSQSKTSSSYSSKSSESKETRQSVSTATRSSSSPTGSRSSSRTSFNSHESWGDRSVTDEGENWGDRWMNQSSGSDGRISPEEITAEQAVLVDTRFPTATHQPPKSSFSTTSKPQGRTDWHSHSQSKYLTETTPSKPTISNPESNPESVEELSDNPFADPNPNPRQWPKRL